MASNEPLINNDDNDNDAEMANNEATTTTTSDNKDGDDTERKPKRSPNRLMVDDVSEVVQGDGDNSCVLLSVCKMEGKALHIHNTSYLSTDAKSHHDTKKRIYRIEQSNQRLQQQQMIDLTQYKHRLLSLQKANRRIIKRNKDVQKQISHNEIS
eukprot:549682_1